MIANIIGAVIAAAVGLLIAFANYIFSKKVLLKSPEKYSGSFVIRQILQVAYLVLVYFIGSKTQIADLAYLLVGAVHLCDRKARDQTQLTNTVGDLL